LDELTDDVDIVFHQAAVVSVEKSVEEPESCHEVNTDATLHLLELARAKDFRLVLASSAAIYGEPETIPISEADSKTPTSPYGIDKWTIDRYAQVYNDLYDTETVALRYFNIYGPRQRGGDYGGVISIFRDRARWRTDYRRRRRLADARFRPRRRRRRGQPASSDDRAYRGSVQHRPWGTDEHRRARRDDMRRCRHRLEVTYTDPRPGDIDESVADISKARSELGFEPTVSLREGLKTIL